jgi:hypothetical protein
MTKNRWIIAIVVVLVVAVAAVWLLRRRDAGTPVTDLLTLFPTAEKRQGEGATVLGVQDVTINGETKKAICVVAATRVTFKVTLPNDAWLRTSIALDPKAWTAEGDGVLFRIGISDGRTYEQVFQQHVNPFRSSGDRRWIPVAIDLSAYGGRQMDLIFNTNASLPGGNDPRNDYALWGAPAIYLR